VVVKYEGPTKTVHSIKKKPDVQWYKEKRCPEEFWGKLQSRWSEFKTKELLALIVKFKLDPAIDTPIKIWNVLSRMMGQERPEMLGYIRQLKNGKFGDLTETERKVVQFFDKSNVDLDPF